MVTVSGESVVIIFIYFLVFVGGAIFCTVMPRADLSNQDRCRAFDLDKLSIGMQIWPACGALD